MRERLALKASLAFILFLGGIVLAVGALTQSIPEALLGSGLMLIGLYWFYVRYYRQRKPRHPFGPPDGKPDIYFPRSNIPRPLYEDMRRMKEKEKEEEGQRENAKKGGPDGAS